jgi:hypothetical protein
MTLVILLIFHGQSAEVRDHVDYPSVFRTHRNDTIGSVLSDRLNPGNLQLSSFPYESSLAPGTYRSGLWTYTLATTVFDASALRSSRTLPGGFDGKARKLVAVDEGRVLEGGAFVLADAETNCFYRAKFPPDLDPGRVLGTNERSVFDLEPISFFDMVSSFTCEGRLIMEDGGCEQLTDSTKLFSTERHCELGRGLNWEGGRSGYPVPHLIDVGSEQNGSVGVGAWVDGSVRFSISYTFPAEFTAELDLSLHTRVELNLSLPATATLPAWTQGETCTTLEQMDLSILGVSVSLSPQLCGSFGIDDLFVSLPEAFTYVRSLNLDLNKHIDLTRDGMSDTSW